MTNDSLRNDPFSKILRNEIPCNKVYETNNTLIFHDINPAAPLHCIAITKKFYSSYDEFLNLASNEEISDFWRDIAYCASNVLNLKSGYRVVSNSGSGGKQEVPYIHVHIMSF
jgi:diadenosine tetraphosphate (Ap4A) HIT family hydrolase